MIYTADPKFKGCVDFSVRSIFIEELSEFKRQIIFYYAFDLFMNAVAKLIKENPEFFTENNLFDEKTHEVIECLQKQLTLLENYPHISFEELISQLPKSELQSDLPPKIRTT